MQSNQGCICICYVGLVVRLVELLRLKSYLWVSIESSMTSKGRLLGVHIIDRSLSVNIINLSQDVEA